jgi:hypothetical protein
MKGAYTLASTITIQDKSTISGPGYFWELPVATEKLTVREMIKIRVFEEVTDYNAQQPDLYRGLVQLTEAEQTLNGYKMLKRREIDWDEQYESAVQAFQQNGFLILVNDQQVTELDDVIEILPETSVTFLKLVPLVGG